MNLPIPGAIHVTGEHDTGKTTFALECGARPDKICFVDDDVKGHATVEELRNKELKFGAYHDLATMGAGLRQVELHEACMELIGRLAKNQFDVIVWDTWTRFAKTFRHVVMANPNEFRLPKEWSALGRIKGAEMNQEAQFYEARVIGSLLEIAPTVVLVTHLKDFYLNNAKTGKKIPASSRTLTRVPRLRIWLRHNPASPVPIGLVLKRLDEKIVTERGLRTVCILPRKITPREGEQSLWDSILRYYEEPVGLRAPAANETPDEFELSILDGTLTAEQKYTFRLMLKAGAGKEESSGRLSESRPESEKPASEVQRLASEGKNAREIAKATGKKLPVVKALLRNRT